MTKSELRVKFKELRASLTDEQCGQFSLQIANQVLKLPVWDLTWFHVFLPIEKQREINTEYILHILAGKEKKVVISKSNFDDWSMKHYELTEDTLLSVNGYGIPEPREGTEVSPAILQVIFLPLLAFDRSGNRIGYGKGFYDRFLSEVPKTVVKIGLSYFDPVDAVSDVSATDMKMDYCVTPDRIWEF